MKLPCSLGGINFNLNKSCSSEKVTKSLFECFVRNEIKAKDL